jgi:hypothetical protein
MKAQTRVKYVNFSSAQADFPVFMEDWYLDAVCGAGNWDSVILEQAGQVIALWSFFIKKRWGVTYVSMPVLGRFMGPFIGSGYREEVRMAGILERLSAMLPRFAGLSQDFHYNIRNWLPLYWSGFRQTVRYSYQVDLSDMAACWQGLASDYRNQKIPRASEAVVVSTGDNLEAFFRVHEKSFHRRGIRSGITYALLQKIDSALRERNQRAIFFATDRQTGDIHAVSYLIWDRRSAYYLLAGDDPAFRSSGAGILLVWEAMNYTSNSLGLPLFDFSGSMIKSVERVRRQFGAKQQMYFRLERPLSLPFRIMAGLRAFKRSSVQ